MPCCEILRRVSGEQTVLQLFGWILGGLSLFMASIAFQNDLDWNDVVLGNSDLKLGEGKTNPEFPLFLEPKQQVVFLRDTKLENVYLIVLSAYLLLSIAIYTCLWIRFRKIKSTAVASIGATFHGLGAILLACLSIYQLNGISIISTHNKQICNGVYDENLHYKINPNEVLKFLHAAMCICTKKYKSSTGFEKMIFNLDTLKDLGICQNTLLKQMAGITLFFCTMIALVLACTQFKDVMVMKTAATNRIRDGLSRVRPVGYIPNSVGPICSCTKTDNNLKDETVRHVAKSNENNNANIAYPLGDISPSSSDEEHGGKTTKDINVSQIDAESHFSTVDEIVTIASGKMNRKRHNEKDSDPKTESLRENNNDINENESIPGKKLRLDTKDEIPEKKESLSTTASEDAPNAFW